MTREYVEANRRHWNEVVPLHAASPLYDLPAFKAGAPHLKPIELEEVGDVRGKSLLHLQCHFGMDTIAWARDAGAVVTGVDFAPAAVETATRLAAEMQVPARFVCSIIDELPDALGGQFDVVFTSYGVLGWLPDLRRWAQVAAHYVRPGGFFYIVEFHPFVWLFDDTPGLTELRFRYPYFPTPEPLRDEHLDTYAAPGARIENHVRYNFAYTLGDTTSALIDAGLRIDYLHEFPHCPHQVWPCTESRPDGMFGVPGQQSLPLIFSIRATRP